MKLFTLTLLLASSLLANAQDGVVLKETRNFLGTLSPELRLRAQYAFDDAERFTWNFVPIKRNGLTFYDFSDRQRETAMMLLKSSLSEQGYQKATAIIALENILKVVEKQAPDSRYRDPLNYHFTVFGDPAEGKPWAWRFEGHHVALNFTSIGGEMVSSTPSFFGSNPGIVKEGESKGQEVLKEETKLGFELIHSLNADQRGIAIFSEKAPAEIISGNNRKAVPLTPDGISLKELSKEQQTLFLKLLDVYVKNYAFGFSKKLMDKIKNAGMENLHFAWAGSLVPGVANYYRIQGPMLLIEYDNTQNNANHVHTTVRDLKDDFAEDILREHYAKEH
ncbi:MAG: DUF3500 domain-containing protein [Cyclobacteriaceae bacterium]